MTLRARLLSLTLSSVAVMALTMLVLDLNSLAISSIEVARSSSDMAAHQVQSFIRRRIEETTTGGVPQTLEGVKRVWRDALEGDADIKIGRASCRERE